MPSLFVCLRRGRATGAALLLEEPAALRDGKVGGGAEREDLQRQRDHSRELATAPVIGTALGLGGHQPRDPGQPARFG